MTFRPSPFCCFFFILFIVTLRTFGADDSRSDSADILRYHISLDIRNLPSKTISGKTIITVVPLKPLSQIRVDLLKLNVTGIVVDANPLPFTRNDSMLFIHLDQTYNPGDTFNLEISYNGQPQADPKWGGFYFTGNYAFNMGVGFVLDPHAFGRCWFPCFDNFVERTSYRFTIRTDSSYKAVCNGLLTDTVMHSDNSISWLWTLDEQIPTYLAQVAVSRYEFVNSVYGGQQRNIPVQLVAQKADTTSMKTSFTRLPDAIGCFENRYGPYQFSKVGFTLVPFNSGAMEHATNVAYPVYAADGSFNYETLFAHELSHSWWGNLVTCRTPEEMWINEGWASYSEKLFLEQVYGRAAYKNAVRANHLNVLRFAHLIDGDFRPVGNVPHQFTYGEHVYHKGADVIHALRGYMGDSAFFAACRSFLSVYRFKNAGNKELMDHFQLFTPVDLTTFFDDRIKSKGFSDIHLTNVKVNNSAGLFKVVVSIRQDLRAAPRYYANVPIDITFYKQDWTKITRQITLPAGSGDFEFSLDFDPLLTVLDEDEKLSNAVTVNSAVYKSIATIPTLPDALMQLKIIAIADSALVRVEHHWSAPDRSAPRPAGIYLSNYRYWVVDGIWPAGFKAQGFFSYDGTTPSVFNSGYLDHTLICTTEDSLFILWRPDGVSAWTLLPDSIVLRQNQSNSTDKIGRFWVKDLRKGEYTLGAMDQQLAGVGTTGSIRKEFKVVPNPASQIVKLEFNFPHDDAAVTIVNLQGQTLLKTTVAGIQNNVSLDISMLAKGYYSVTFDDGSHHLVKKLSVH